MKPKTVVIIIIVTMTAIFILQNTHPVAVNILFFSPEFPLVVLIGIMLAIGFVVGFAVKSLPSMKDKDKKDF